CQATVKAAMAADVTNSKRERALRWEERGLSQRRADSGDQVPARDLSRAPTLGEAAGAMRAAVDGNAVATFDGVSTDSRTVRASNLFFCLRGPNFDAHDFIAAAAAT